MVFDLSTLRNENLSTISTLVDYVEEPESNVLESDYEYTPEQLNKLHKNVLNRSLEAEVEEAFSLFDRNGDQKIDFFECQAAFKALRLNISPENVKELYKDIGKDEKDFLTITDFKTLVISRIHTRYNNTEIQKIFNQLQDGTGKITLESLRSSINKIGVEISDEELTLMVSEASTNKTYILYDDFAKLLKRSWTGDPLDMIFE
ncbi:centrin [Theileria orientalis strain Shintoku]|uniref:Centrin n=1 Tax=Theileria orientalis strain Shintoku TaxID=869250 RepID=J4C4B1_THEOR|nr:centrin [Theileria orientalis strain Shintoku]PVC52888.1 centrin [Theileria orientalis]BAM41876.1 centrin [Theileria orientalis strain Shintoku]|eukprot:XP_009692177.1 centrin [Theileria orientalis strain Shintoku]